MEGWTGRPPIDPATVMGLWHCARLGGIARTARCKRENPPRQRAARKREQHETRTEAKRKAGVPRLGQRQGAIQTPQEVPSIRSSTAPCGFRGGGCTVCLVRLGNGRGLRHRLLDEVARASLHLGIYPSQVLPNDADTQKLNTTQEVERNDR
jgi:hypothetical protein